MPNRARATYYSQSELKMLSVSVANQEHQIVVPLTPLFPPLPPLTVICCICLLVNCVFATTSVLRLAYYYDIHQKNTRLSGNIAIPRLLSVLPLSLSCDCRILSNHYLWRFNCSGPGRLAIRQSTAWKTRPSPHHGIYDKELHPLYKNV